jgi:hypothetical protein
MATSFKIKDITRQDLLSFLEEISCSNLEFKLLCFWARHPRAAFSLFTISQALDCPVQRIKDSLSDLVYKKIITVSDDNNELLRYALSECDPVKYVEELGRLDWSEQLILWSKTRIKSETVTGKYRE